MTFVDHWIALVAVVLIVGINQGCEPPPPRRDTDQCLRRQIFAECLAHVPQGPRQTGISDWAEVVDECEDAAMYQSVRITDSIPAGCR